MEYEKTKKQMVEKGKHFEPRIVDLFLDNSNRVIDIFHKFNDE